MKKIIISILTICLLCSNTFATEGTNKTIKTNKVIVDEISQSGEVDYFNFELKDPGSLQITFEFDIEGSYTVKLINAKTGKTVQNNSFSSSVNTVSGRTEQASNKIRISEGEYQLQVSRGYFSTCTEEYELTVSYEEESSDRYEKESNNSAKEANIIDYNKNVIGNLEYSSDVDYYMVELPEKGELYTQLKFDKDVSYNVVIYAEENGALKTLQSNRFTSKLSQNSATYTDFTEKLRVPAGNYYFKIASYWNSYSNEDYTFSVRYLGNSYGCFEEENNNEPRYATNIVANTEFVGNLNSSSDVDYYMLSIWDSNKLTIKMNVPEGASYNVVTYKDVNGELSKLKSETFTSKDLYGTVIGQAQEIEYGNYYFRVTSRTYSNHDYTFLIETNNTLYNPNRSTIVLEINNPYMLVNGQTYAIDGNRGTAPTILNGRTMLPARAVVEHLGGTVIWNEGARGISITLNGKNVYLTLDNTLAYVNGEAKYLDVAPTSINGRTMVPVKFVMDNLGGSVIWNATTGAVTITY